MSVYIIGAAIGAEIVKIGWSVEVKKRLSSLQTSSPTPLKVLRLIESDFGAERWMHDRFKPLRMKGEWFRVDPEMFTVEPPKFAGRKQRTAEAIAIIAARKHRPNPAVISPYPIDAIGKPDTNVARHHFDYAVGSWVPDTAEQIVQTELQIFKVQMQARIGAAMRRGLSLEHIIDAMRNEIAAIAAPGDDLQVAA